MAGSIHHDDVVWCVVGPVSILYHTSISMNTAVTYDERSVFGSHGAYAVWTGTAPRSYSVTASMVAANSSEVVFNLKQVYNAYQWTQQSPPQCAALRVGNGGLKVNGGSLYNDSVRIESFDSSIPDATFMDAGIPIQIELSMSLKECKPI